MEMSSASGQSIIDARKSTVTSHTVDVNRTSFQDSVNEILFLLTSLELFWCLITFLDVIGMVLWPTELCWRHNHSTISNDVLIDSPWWPWWAYSVARQMTSEIVMARR